MNGCFYRAGTTLPFSTLDRTRAYAIETTQPVGPELAPGGAIIDGDFAPDASWVALACSDVPERAHHPYAINAGSGTVQFWNYRSGERLGEGPTPTCRAPAASVCIPPGVGLPFT
ncbi:MAG: hypothetical protein U1G07_15765 [Verrucomicrobiota bacterium]